MLKKYILKGEHRLTGIYFLIFKSEIVYIGQTVNFFARLSNHETEDSKKFDTVRLLQCNAIDLDYYEKRWIIRFRPKYNFRHIKKYKWIGLMRRKKKIVEIEKL